MTSGLWMTVVPIIPAVNTLSGEVVPQLAQLPASTVSRELPCQLYDDPSYQTNRLTVMTKNLPTSYCYYYSD